MKPHFAPPFRPPRALPGVRARTLDLPGYRQVRSYTCGYAVALMVVRFFRPDAPARELFERLGTGRDGTRQTAIVRELRASGLGANVRYDMDFERYCAAFDAGKPVIGYHHGIEHWVALYGYARDPEDLLFVADSRAGVPSVYRYGDYAAHLRGFGIVCSDRSTQAPAADDEPISSEPGSPQLAFEFG